MSFSPPRARSPPTPSCSAPLSLPTIHHVQPKKEPTMLVYLPLRPSTINEIIEYLDALGRDLPITTGTRRHLNSVVLPELRRAREDIAFSQAHEDIPFNEPR